MCRFYCLSKNVGIYCARLEKFNNISHVKDSSFPRNLHPKSLTCRIYALLIYLCLNFQVGKAFSAGMVLALTPKYCYMLTLAATATGMALMAAATGPIWPAFCYTISHFFFVRHSKSTVFALLFMVPSSGLFPF